MARHPRLALLVVLVLILAVLGAGTLGAQNGTRSAPAADISSAASSATDLRIIVSLAARHLWVVREAADTLLSAPVAVGSGRTLRAAGRTWTFETPRGIRSVLSKEIDPVWIRPDWSYAEAAAENHLRLDSVSATRPRPLSAGRTLVVRANVVGIQRNSASLEVVPVDDEIVFGDVLYMPPIGTDNRAVPGVLGAYRLNLGDGIGLHGTSDDESIGQAVTHGCLRLSDAALEWAFANLPVGTHVYIY